MKEPVCELSKNSRETIHFRLGEYKGQGFIDMRVLAKDDGKNRVPGHGGVPHRIIQEV
jgi:hypothetical protein